MKAFCRKRIPESNCLQKETLDRDIVIMSRNGDRKIMQPIRITSGPAMRTSGTSGTSSDEHLQK